MSKEANQFVIKDLPQNVQSVVASGIQVPEHISANVPGIIGYMKFMS